MVEWERLEARLLDTGANTRALEMHRRGHPKYRTRRILLGSDKEDMKSYAREMQRLREMRKKTGEPDNITLDALIERDRGICYICNKKVGERIKYDRRTKKDLTDRRKSPTVDHVVPLSRGGLHTWENVRLAHWSCNSRKGGRLLDN